MTVIKAQALTSGRVQGEIALLTMPLSLWGGLDVEGGHISDVTHPQHGQRIAGRIVAMTEARGSSSSSSALVEAARLGTAPLAIVLGRLDPILVIGSLVAADLYGVQIPIVLVSAADWPRLCDGRVAEIVATAQAATIAL